MKKTIFLLVIMIGISVSFLEYPAFASQETFRQELISAGIPAGSPTYLADYWANVVYNNIDNKRTDWQNSEFITSDVTLTAYGRLAVYDMLVTLKNQLTSINSGLGFLGEYLYSDSAKRNRWVAAQYLTVTNYAEAGPGNGRPVDIDITAIGQTAIANMEAFKIALENAGIPGGVSDAYADFMFTDSSFRQYWTDASLISVVTTGSTVTNITLTAYGQIAAGEMYRVILGLQAAGIPQWAAERMSLVLYGNVIRRSIAASKGLIKIASSSQARSVWGLSSATEPANDTAYHVYTAPLGMSHASWIVNGNTDNSVITPYASFLALDVAPEAAMQNISNLINNYAGIKGTYGFFDSVDTDNGDIANIYLTLDQGDILISIANAVENGCIQGFFMNSGPIVASRANLNKDYSGIVTDPTASQLDTTALSSEQKLTLKQIAQETWNYFASMTNASTNWLPPDYRAASGAAIDFTTPTDIALYLMGIVSAEKLGIIDSATAQQRVADTLATLALMGKWNGLFHNYYKVDTLSVVTPTEKFISTVDNGWLASALLVVRQAYSGTISASADALFNAMQFGKLYNSAAGLLANGVNPINGTTGTQTSSCYGNIYTEIRPTVLVAIGKGDVPSTVWNNMAATYSSDWTWQSQVPQNGAYTYMVDGSPFHYIPTWDGTMFEALMPNLVIDNKTYSTNGFAIQDRAYVFLQKLFATGALDPGYTRGSDAVSLTAYGQTAFGIVGTLINAFVDMAGVTQNTAMESALRIFTDDAFRADWVNKGYITVTMDGSQVTGVTITSHGSTELPSVLSGAAMVLEVHQAIIDHNLQNAFQLMYGIASANQSLNNAEYKGLITGIASYISEHSDPTKPDYFTKENFVNELEKTAELHSALVAQGLKDMFEAVTGIPIGHQDPVGYPIEYRANLAGIVNGPGYGFQTYIASLKSVKDIHVALDNPTSLRMQFQKMYGIVARLSLEQTHNFVYQLQNVDLQKLGSTAANLVIMDYSSDGSKDAEYTKEEVSVLKNSSGGKIVLSYMSIGEAEDYRWYWDNSWVDASGNPTAGAPSWLGPTNPEWAGNYKVKYWDPGWQKMIFGEDTPQGHVDGYLDKIIAEGFNGVYLDIIDAYEYWGPGGESGLNRETAAQDMVDFVKAIAEYARVRKDIQDFVVIPQNGEGLSIYPDYVAAVSGIGKEDLFTNGDLPQSQAYIDQAVQDLNRFKAAGKLVLVIDYPSTTTLKDSFYTKVADNGYIGYAATRPLDQLTTPAPAAAVGQALVNPAYLQTLQGIASYMSSHPEYAISNFRYELENTAALHTALDAYNLRAVFEAKSGISVADQIGITDVYRGYLAGVVNGSGYTLGKYLTGTLGWAATGDLFASFSSNGFWRYSNNQWNMLTASSVESFMLSEKRSDSSYDVIGDFGSGGMWRYSSGQWSNLTMANSESFLLSSLSNSSYDVIGDFGQGGLWKYSGSTWTMLTESDATSFSVSRSYNGSYDIIGDFAAEGLWRYSNNSWNMLSGSATDSYITTDIHNNSYDLIGDFGQGGLWRYSSSAWTMLTQDNVEQYKLSDRYDGSYDLIGDFGEGGLWRYSNNAWTMLTLSNAEDFAISDSYDNGTYDLIGDFGQSGLWRYSGSAWQMLTAENAKSFVLSETYNGGYDIIGNFGQGGLWRYSGSAWTMLAAEDARSITLSYNYAGASYDIVADFGAKGTWKRSDNTWTELTAAAPSAEISDKMAVLNAVGTPGQSAPNGYTFSRALSGCPSNRRLGSAIWK